ncbi:MAG: PTS sugar transporter subunit IIA [Thermoanaerobaculia bacterium]|nr:PTS sugar transporter subunit IIA [Thermoanaerobaculia bacterium]
MELQALTEPDLIFPGLPAFDIPSVLRAFADRLAGADLVADGDKLYEALWEREQLGSTGIGEGVAVPHCKLAKLKRVILAIGHVPKGIDFAAVDKSPVQLFFCVVSPESEPAAHLQCLQAISAWLKQNDESRRILEMDDPEAIYEFLSRG